MCRFKRMFVGIGSSLEVAKACGIGYSALDACHYKHMQYRDGLVHMLVTRDGNNQGLPLAYMIAETESGDSWNHFGLLCHAFGVGAFFDKANSVLCTDRMKGIARFLEVFPGLDATQCWKHITNNFYKHFPRAKVPLKLLWQLQRAHTWDLWFEKLKIVAQYDVDVSNWLNELEHHKVYKYMQLEKGIATCGHSTNNISEVMHSAFNKARHEHPYFYNDMILKWFGVQFFNRALKAKKNFGRCQNCASMLVFESAKICC